MQEMWLLMPDGAGLPSPHYFAHFYEGPRSQLGQPLVVLAAFSANQNLQAIGHLLAQVSLPSFQQHLGCITHSGLEHWPCSAC